MKTVDVRGPYRYTAYVGPGALADRAITFCEHYPRCFVLTDANVAPLHLGLLDGLKRKSHFVVPAGEESKSFATLERVLDAMVAAALDRSCGLLALGGGVVGDLGGMAASLFMRGIDFIPMPTSLLSMVDSSIGGKTGVNLPAGKNLAGAFHHPREVYADTSTLTTLPEEEFRSGLGEVVKTAVIAGFEERLSKQAPRIRRRDPETLTDLVHDCMSVKAQVVARDPGERNVRKHLNLGHTFAHGIEKAAGFGRIPHGIAVGVGLMLALRASHELDKLADGELEPRTRALLEQFELPRSLNELRAHYDAPLDPADIVRAMRSDKKGKAGKIRLVLPVFSGMCVHDVVVDEPMLLDLLAGG